MKRFRLDNQVAIITGGAGLLGTQHAEAIAEVGGIPVIVDIDESAASRVSKEIKKLYGINSTAFKTDITKIDAIRDLAKRLLQKYRKIDILINNAANDPKFKGDNFGERFENISLKKWHDDIAVGLTGAFLCSQVFGTLMSKSGGGVILNISSDLGLIAPDQRIYRKKGLSEEEQPVKPVTYSVVKHGLIGLTKYLATYWADKRIRVNALCPGGLLTDQPPEFVKKLSNLIPLGRMARIDEYKAAIQFLCSDASSYMTGSCLVMDGGRSSW